MDPILLDLPEAIHTPRLILRWPRPGEGAELNAAIAETIHELKEWMPWAQEMPSAEDSEANVRRAHAKIILREDLRVSIYDRATGKFAGGSGLHRINWDVPSFEIGYWVRSCFAGKGYIKESTNALTRFAFAYLKAKRVEIRCNSRNERSLGVMKSLGFEYEGCLRNEDTHCKGEGTRDTLVYARLNIDGLPPLAVSWGKALI